MESIGFKIVSVLICSLIVYIRSELANYCSGSVCLYLHDPVTGQQFRMKGKWRRGQHQPARTQPVSNLGHLSNNTFNHLRESWSKSVRWCTDLHVIFETCERILCKNFWLQTVHTHMKICSCWSACAHSRNNETCPEWRTPFGLERLQQIVCRVIVYVVISVGFKICSGFTHLCKQYFLRCRVSAGLICWIERAKMRRAAAA